MVLRIEFEDRLVSLFGLDCRLLPDSNSCRAQHYLNFDGRMNWVGRFKPVGDRSRRFEIATREGRAASEGLKIGICGEHGGDPRSIAFC